eukprot:TRINITY_DN2188_c0_g1_i2.p3 TRINITY_DN2188_c0_g1~~TRINITY_DN2188_c0_g1_i2.p3  ORF type:complete len:109 (-),score=9.75 TRINITY_DN2188_c0_g1_i2:1338-1664(-)
MRRSEGNVVRPGQVLFSNPGVQRPFKIEDSDQVGNRFVDKLYEQQRAPRIVRVTHVSEKSEITLKKHPIQIYLDIWAKSIPEKQIAVRNSQTIIRNTRIQFQRNPIHL